MLKTLTMLLATVAPGHLYTGTVVKVIDGDTIRVSVKRFAGTPFNPIDLRILGIDTPEVEAAIAKCPQEVTKGIAAQTYARSLVHVGDVLKWRYQGLDKYAGRVDARLSLQDGRDFGTVMISSGLAKPYSGVGPKPDWCQ